MVNFLGVGKFITWMWYFVGFHATALLLLL